MLTIMFLLVLALLASVVALALRVADLERSVEDAHEVLDGLVESWRPVPVNNIVPSRAILHPHALDDLVEMIRGAKRAVGAEVGDA